MASKMFFNIHETLSFHKRFFIAENAFLGMVHWKVIWETQNSKMLWKSYFETFIKV